jgi:phosphoglycolate phosphatase
VGSGPAGVCVFDLDHTLVRSPLDLVAVAREMEACLRERGHALPARALRWSGPEIYDLVRRDAPHLADAVLAIPVAHERRAMTQAQLEPGAVETLVALRGQGLALGVWTNNDRVAAEHVLRRFDLARHLDLVVTRDDVQRLKPDPDGLRVVRERWPDAERLVVVGDSWVDGAAAQAGGVPFVAYRADRDELARRGIAVAARIDALLDLAVALAGSGLPDGVA